jgi:hypothetical protein
MQAAPRPSACLVDQPMSYRIVMNRDYAAALPAQLKNGFKGLLAKGKYPKVSGFEAKPFVDAIIAKVPLIKYFFLKFLEYITVTTQKPQCLGA